MIIKRLGTEFMLFFDDKTSCTFNTASEMTKPKFVKWFAGTYPDVAKNVVEVKKVSNRYYLYNIPDKDMRDYCVQHLNYSKGRTRKNNGGIEE